MKSETCDVIISGKQITFETGKIARQAAGAVMARCGDTMVLATACASSAPLPEIDFLPLRVDYQAKLSSTGKTSSGFVKREGKPSQSEILVSRLIDRPLRPMFPDGYFHDVQIIASVFSYDSIHSPDVLAICASSAALAISEIPLSKPIGAVRVGLVNDQFVVNPTSKEQTMSTLDLVIAGTEDAVLMIEGGASFLTEEQLLEAITIGHRAVADICKAIHAFQQRVGKSKKTDTIKPVSTQLQELIHHKWGNEINEALHIHVKDKREDACNAIDKAIIEALSGEAATPKHDVIDVRRALEYYRSHAMRQMVLKEQVRCDGRKLSAVRPIHIEQGLLPRAHGSSLFTRGETQSLAVCVLGPENMGQRYEDLDGEGIYRFYLQYFFPPYSVGEVSRLGTPGRREIGHGNLAERALETVIPPKEQFPYTIRLESNITESNGSSSMASVCGGCLALMDAGVPIKRPVAGVAMGLILEGGHASILTDILGIEDALGDMDFKVAGDHSGITAVQMDIKVEGITLEIMKQALAAAKEGRTHILNLMLSACPKPRPQMSVYAPRIETMQVKPSKIAVVIGPGGKQIRSIIEQTGVEIDINDDGVVSLSAQSQESIDKAKAIIHGLTAEAEVGKVYKGKITDIVDFGFFVEILPGKEGLLHVSEMDLMRIPHVQEYAKANKFEPGSEMDVEVIGINERGQIKLGRKSLLQREKQHHERHAPEKHAPERHTGEKPSVEKASAPAQAQQSTAPDAQPQQPRPRPQPVLIPPPPIIQRKS